MLYLKVTREKMEPLRNQYVEPQENELVDEYFFSVFTAENAMKTRELGK